MADELQALLDKINDEGVEKARQQQDAILAQARKDAQSIIDAAKSQAAKITAEAEAQATMFQQKGQEALRQAARDIILNLKQTLQERVRKAATDLMKETLDHDKLAAVIAQIITRYAAENGDVDDLTLLVSQAQLEPLETAVKAQLAEELKAHCHLAPANGFATGFKLVFSSNDVMYDFSDQALADVIAAYVGPKVAAAVNP